MVARQSFAASLRPKYSTEYERRQYDVEPTPNGDVPLRERTAG